MPPVISSIAPQEVRIPSGDARLYGDLTLPEAACCLVLFAHGSGSGRHSARNRLVARRLHQEGIATLLFDMRTAEEEQLDLHSGEPRFDLPLMTRRLQEATEWAADQSALRDMPIGYFGASTGSAAALIAAARLGDRIGAVVSRGGRADLAGPAVLGAVTAPTLLIVGGADTAVAEFNQQALGWLRCSRQLAIVPAATHLFEEPGALEQVAGMATAWFTGHLTPVENLA